MLLKWTNVQNFAMQLPKPSPPLFEQFSGDAVAFPAAYLILHDRCGGLRGKIQLKKWGKHDSAIDGGAPGGGGAGIGAGERGAVALVSILGIRG